MLKALLWKEWREQQWRVALATVWLLGLTAIGLKTRILPDLMILLVIWVPTVLILPVFFGMGLFASERRAGTLSFLMVQPVERRTLLTAKAMAGLLAYTAPLLIGGIVVCLAVGGREASVADLSGRIVVIAVFGAALFGWQLLAGLRSRREETYILASVIVIGFWIVQGLVVDEWRLDQSLGHWIWTINPISVAELFDAWESRSPYAIWTTVAVQSLITAGLMLGLWLRFRNLREGRS
jgi:hypothetical protein